MVTILGGGELLFSLTYASQYSVLYQQNPGKLLRGSGVTFKKANYVFDKKKEYAGKSKGCLREVWMHF